MFLSIFIDSVLSTTLGQSNFTQSQVWQSLLAHPSRLWPRIGVRGKLFAGVTIDDVPTNSKCDCPDGWTVYESDRWV